MVRSCQSHTGLAALQYGSLEFPSHGETRVITMWLNETDRAPDFTSTLRGSAADSHFDFARIFVCLAVDAYYYNFQLLVICSVT